MSRVKDMTSGTGALPATVPFPSGKRYALSIMIFCDGEEPISEGYASSAEAQARGVLQTAGRDVASVRFVHRLDSQNDSTAAVSYDLHVTREVADGDEVVEA